MLRTKLYPPRLPRIVPRERLLSDLDTARSAKLAIVTAGAGYGKSTLAGDFLAKTGRPFAWYTLEDTDSDLSVFITYLVAALRNVYPEFGAKTTEHLAATENLSENSRAILSTLISELDAITSDEIFITLDDFHEVNESKPILDAVQFLLGHLLPNLHFLVLSRNNLNLDLSNFRVRRELVELEEGDLSFTPEETGALFAEVFGMPLSREDAMTLYESTEGWISGLVLFYLALKGKQGGMISSFLQELGGPPSAVSDYLSKAVYENQVPEIQDFLTKTSILARMNPDFCRQYLGADISADILSRLTEERLFTIPLDDRGDWYRYHHCLRGFLHKTLYETHSPAEIKEMHMKAAALWEDAGDSEQVLAHYMEAANYEAAAILLEQMDNELLRANRISFLDREIARLPQDILHAHPRLLVRVGQVGAILGHYERGLVSTHKALESFDKLDLRLGVQALLWLGGYYAITGKPHEALEFLNQAHEVIPPESPYLYYVEAEEGVAAMGQGNADEARKLMEGALEKSKEVESGRRVKSGALTWIGGTALLLGSPSEARQILSEADLLPQAAGLTLVQPFLYALLSRSCSYLDQFEDAKRFAEKGIQIGEQMNLPPMLFFSLAARAIARAQSGDTVGAAEDVATAASQSEQQVGGGEALFAEWFLADACELLGDEEGALRHFRRVERMASTTEDFSRIARLGIIANSIGASGAENAAKEVRAILKEAKDGVKGLTLSLAYSLSIGLALALDDKKEATRLLNAYVTEFGEEVIIRAHPAEPDVLLDFFTSIFDEGKHLDLMPRIFSGAGARSLPFLRKLEAVRKMDVAIAASAMLERASREEAEPLSIRMLGPLEIRLGKEMLPPSAWKNKKALAAFKYLAANRSQGFVPRVVLMELLWPEINPDSGGKNLNVALTSLRKTLEPDSPRGKSSYLVVSGDALRLELGAGGWIDVEMFREKFREADATRESGDFEVYFRCLHEAAELYRGEFLTEDLYEDWCREDREELLKRYVELIVDIATEHLRVGEGSEALMHLEEAIVKDPGREELYRKKMTINSQMGNRSGIEETFKRCEKFLRENYEVEPSQETVELYQSLRKD